MFTLAVNPSYANRVFGPLYDNPSDEPLDSFLDVVCLEFHHLDDKLPRHDEIIVFMDAEKTSLPEAMISSEARVCRYRSSKEDWGFPRDRVLWKNHGDLMKQLSVFTI